MSVGTSGSRPRAAHLGPERRRPQILDAALEIAIGEGVAAVTIGAVADKLNVTRPVVYSCFGDRVELIKAMLRREEQYLLFGAIAALPRGRVNADEQVFVDGFRALLTTVAERPESWRIVFDADPDPAVANLFGRGRSVVADSFARGIKPTLEFWQTKDIERKLPVLIEHFMSASEGAVRSLLNESNDWSAVELAEFIGPAVYRAFRHA
ncbi:TetR/AcrR family transcriptional regulator [Antrihabitans cavernicola]|uniref:TetR/AcrR family transcriptional regulator n=1 Tax=Antrihabitans cavernicola TaxID=2495913 RepID=A0A5A7S6Y7_9NOCA|nr:TetR/AcrR family transcriptional regulator [Spelaeibacter cavernicola]KAA0021646.1 TetR/AcrR family transcriptional regulator [Spelaeibacter cavernicola]